MECGPVNAVSAVSRGNNPRISSSPSLAFSERPDYLAVLNEGVLPLSQNKREIVGITKLVVIPIGQVAVRGSHSLAQLNGIKVNV